MLRVIKKVVVQTFVSLLVIVLVLIGGIIAALQTAPVQTYLAKEATDYVSAKLGFPISIQYVHIHWLDRAEFKNILLLDQEGQRMIEVPSLEVDFTVSSLMEGGNTNIDEVILKEAKVRLIKSKKTRSLNIDEFILAVNKLTDTGTTTRSKKRPVFSIDRVFLQDVLFSFDDQRKDTIRDGFDYQHITIDSINATAFNFRLVADTIEIDVDKLTGVDNLTNLDVKDLRTSFRYTKHSMQLTDLNAKIGNSVIGNFVAFKYADPSDLSDFIDKITITAYLDQTQVYSKDLALFAPYLKRYEEFWVLTGDFNGKVKRFRFRDADVRFGQNSKIRGNISFSGLPDWNETLIDLDLRPSMLVAKDLEQYIADTVAFRTVRKFGTVKLNGKFLGFPKDFVANGSFDTDLGRLTSDINLKIKENEAKSSYQGKLTTYKFNIGQLADQPELVQLLDMQGKIEGTGFSVKNASLTLQANINRIGIKQYDYKNIEVDGLLSREQFKGKASVNDTNLVFAIDGEIDLRQGKNLFNIKGNLQKANLKALNFSDKESIVRTQLDVNFQGLQTDEIVGEATFTNGYVLYNNRDIVLDTLYIRSIKDSTGRTFDVHSDFATLHANGNFEFTRLFSDFETLIKEYKLNFSNNEATAQSYYEQKSIGQRKKYRIFYEVNLKDITPIVTLFYPQLYISKNTIVEGNFLNSVTSIATLNSKIDTIIYKEYKFFNNEIDISTSKLADSTTVLASTFLYSAKQKFGDLPPTENIALEAIWSGRTIDFQGKIKQTGSANSADLQGGLSFLPGRIEVQLKPSHFRVLDNDWQIAADNLVTIKGTDVAFKNLSLSNLYQSVSINGTISEDPTKAVQLTIKDFDLRTLNSLIGRNLLGTTNGFVTVQDFYKDLNMQSELSVEELVIDKFLIGDISGEAKWDNESKKVNVNYEIFRLDNQILAVTGTYDPNGKEKALDMQIILNQMNLEILEPFFSSLVTKLGGTASGQLNLQGGINSPILKGKAMVENGRFRFNYLNTIYYFDDELYFSENEIGVKALKLRDENNNVAVITGGVFHDSFRDFVISLQARMRNFKVLNTTYKDNELFYGTAIITGDLSVLGAVNNLQLRANAKSNKGTKIYIPINDTRGIQEQDHIQFIGKSQKAVTALDSIGKNLDLSGIVLDFNFDVTPDAYCEIIFDRKAGDIIRGSGSGKIKMMIDTKGDFTMFGDYTITQGAYNFTLLNVVNKEFKIQSGSHISWSGDPYAGVLDINASYEQLASLLPLFNDPSLQDRPEYNRRYPVTVLLNLTGNLLTPKIDMGIQFKDYPRNSSEFSTGILDFTNRIATNEQELNRQVFSLLVLRKLSPEGAFSGVQGSVGNSVSELLSNQLSYWASQVDENLEINLDLNGLDEEAFNTFQLRLSYSLLEGRLRVTRDGSFTNTQNQSSALSIIGDWTIEYVLNKEGSLRVKMFNRNTQSVLNSTDLNNPLNTVTGFSLLHTKSFNTLWDLFHPKGDRRSERETEKPDTKDEEQQTEPQTKAPRPTNRRKNRAHTIIHSRDN
jgi:hypothetical protein